MKLIFTLDSNKVELTELAEEIDFKGWFYRSFVYHIDKTQINFFIQSNYSNSWSDYWLTIGSGVISLDESEEKCRLFCKAYPVSFLTMAFFVLVLVFLTCSLLIFIVYKDLFALSYIFPALTFFFGFQGVATWFVWCRRMKSILTKRFTATTKHCRWFEQNAKNTINKGWRPGNPQAGGIESPPKSTEGGI